MLKKIEIWTDGACSGNPGPGGWAAILKYKDVEKCISGGNELTTNNVMELTAVIEGLRALKEKCLVDLYTDSNYVVKAINEGWLTAWQMKGYKTADNKRVKNVELWKELVTLLRQQEVKFIKVKGHADNENNNRCDCLARAEIQKLTNK